jgi:hypothetical protein
MNDAEMERSKVEVEGQADAKEGESRRMAYRQQGIVAEDNGEAVLVTVGGAAYARLRRGATALSQTFGGAPPSDAADVFLEFGIVPEVVAHADTELGRWVHDSIWGDMGREAESAEGQETLQELGAELERVGLLERGGKKAEVQG